MTYRKFLKSCFSGFMNILYLMARSGVGDTATGERLRIKTVML